MKKIIILLILVIKSFSQKNNLAPTKIVVDNNHGYETIDEYRNFEDLKNQEVLNWIKNQSINTLSIIERLDKKNNFLNLSEEYDKKYFELRKSISNYPTFKRIISKTDPVDRISRIFYRNSENEEFKVLFSPEDYSKEKKYSIKYYKLSPNENYIAISLLQGENTLSDIVIYDIKNKKLLPDLIENTWVDEIGGIEWLNDESGFFYVYLPIIDDKSPEFLKNTKAVFHKIGSKKENFTDCFSKNNNPSINIKSADFPIIYTTNNNYFIAEISGVTGFYDTYYAKYINPIKKKPNWKLLFKKEQKIKNLKSLNNDIFFNKEIKGESFLFKTNFKNFNFDNAKQIAKFVDDEFINDYIITKDKIFISTLTNGIISKLYVVNNSSLKEIKLPIEAGNITFESYGSKHEKDLWIVCSGWKFNRKRYKIDFSNDYLIEDFDRLHFNYLDFNDYIVKETNVKSHDGIEIPLTIIYNKNINFDGNNRLIIEAYGAYGGLISPYFSPYQQIWINQGGILAYAHVRGGGEKGEKWYYGGYKETKPNSWKDLISCAEYLIENKYTSKEKLGVYGISAGGITVGRAITERPDLFKAAFIDVGVLNTIRLEESPNGANNAKEFGTVNDPKEFKYLLEMDAFQHINKDTQYPATFIKAGLKDSKVIYWQPAKLIANNISQNEILLYVDDEGNHVGRDQKKRYSNLQSINTFFNWQLGNPSFQ